MGHGKETPRQKMIGMMYLFYTALMALNVSKDVLDSFIKINNSMNETNQNFVSKNNIAYASIDKAYAQNPTKAQAIYDASLELKKRTEALIENLQYCKDTVIFYADKLGERLSSTEGVFQLKERDGSSRYYVKLEDIDGDGVDDTLSLESACQSKDNLDIATQIIIGTDPSTPGYGLQLRDSIASYREWLIATAAKFGSDSTSAFAKNVKSSLNTINLL